MSILSLVLQSFSSIVFIAISSLVWGYLKSPIKSIPGPFVAKFTNLWRFFDTYNGRPELTHKILHERYGSAVRLGPNVVSINDPTVLHTIYSTKGEFLKSHFYDLAAPKVGQATVHTVFSTQSNEHHSQIIRPIAKFYKMSSLLKTEPLVDQIIEFFCQRLDKEFVDGSNAGKTCKIDEWFSFFAWDVIGELTFSERMGFLENASDNTGLLINAEKGMSYLATIGQIPALDHWLAKNPVTPIGPPSLAPQAAFCVQQSIARQQGIDSKAREQKDMLDEFLEIKKTNPEQIDDNGVVGAMLINILAGSDTTAILLRAIVYYVLKDPRIHKKLQTELDEANLARPVTYEKSHQLSYLDAVVLEANRVHPGVGLLLERIVPESGLTLADGTVIPPGTIVGMNAWVIHQNKSIFGQDAASFNPDRWLRNIEGEETEEAFRDRLDRMKKADLTFGAGKRICLGRTVAILETYKVIATLFLTYDMSLVDPDKEWHIQNSWFVRQTGIDITIRRRSSVAISAG